MNLSPVQPKYNPWGVYMTDSNKEQHETLTKKRNVIFDDVFHSDSSTSCGGVCGGFYTMSFPSSSSSSSCNGGFSGASNYNSGTWGSDGIFGS